MSIPPPPGQSESLWQLIKNGYAEMRGRSLARNQIRRFEEACHWNFDGKERLADEIKEQFRNSAMKAASSGDGTFERAYNEQWYLLGGKDAQDGIYRGDMLQVAHYVRGWVKELEDMKKKGWWNEKLSDELSLVKSHLLGSWDFNRYLEARGYGRR
ncbi:MAG: hypothetical protein ACJATD_001018 [Alloalcanivorax sp.]|jgi:hypothetical protein